MSKNSDSKAGFHQDDNGSFEVFWAEFGQFLVDVPLPDDPLGDIEPCEAGWYWWSCSPGCLPDGEAQGPYETSELAYEAASAYGPQGDDPTLPIGPNGNTRID